MGASSLGSIWLLVHWQYADLFFRALPPTLFSVLLLFETIRLRTLRRNVEPPVLENPQPQFNKNDRRVSDKKYQQGGMQMLDIVVVTIGCWLLAA